MWPGACSGRVQSWCGSMSSGRTMVGSRVFVFAMASPAAALGGARLRTMLRRRGAAYAVRMLRQLATALAFETRGRGLLEITRPVAEWVSASGFTTGLLTLFIRHTSASLVV